MKTLAGFTLVELMIVTVLTLLGVASALSVVARGRGAYRSVETRAQLEETARAALDTLAREARLAGYLGLAIPGSAVTGATAVGAPPPPDLAVGGGCADSLALDLGRPLSGADGRFAATADLPLDCDPSPRGRVVPGADTFIVRRAGTSPAAPDPGRLQLESQRWAARLLADGQRQLSDDSMINDLEASVFYVSGDATGAIGRPSLRRKRLVGGSAPSFQDEELVGGNPGLREYVPVGAVPQDAQVRSVRFWVLVRSGSAEAAPLEMPALAYANRVREPELSRFPRLLASVTVALRNPGLQP
jgi:hypothetical protein